MTLEEARKDLREKVLQSGEEETCPCCQQTVAVRPRTIHATMAAQLIRIYREGLLQPEGWVNVQKIYRPGAGGDYAKLRFWGLLEARGSRGREENAPGEWRVTSLGVDFVLGRVRIPNKIFTYNNGVVSPVHLGWEVKVEMISIHDALKKKFDYAELMGESGPLFDCW
jgi:hypothetical protein